MLIQTLQTDVVFKVYKDEPYFLLRGVDKLAARTMAHYSDLLVRTPNVEAGYALDIGLLSRAMAEYAMRRQTKWFRDRVNAKGLIRERD